MKEVFQHLNIRNYSDSQSVNQRHVVGLKLRGEWSVKGKGIFEKHKQHFKVETKLSR